jgi:hypothetical protein
VYAELLVEEVGVGLHGWNSARFPLTHNPRAKQNLGTLSTVLRRDDLCSGQSSGSRRLPHWGNLLAHFQAAQLPKVANMPIAAAAITAVASHPSSLSVFVSTNSPMTDLREAMSMIMTMIGTAATPLIIALQIRAFTGSRG